jgi:alanine racemase
MRAWLEIDLAVVSRNFQQVRRYLPSHTVICAVVKADAYGHGIEAIVRTLDRLDVDSFAVISLDEALRVRKETARDVLILGYLDDTEITEAIRQGFILSLYDRQLADLYNGIAERVGKPVRVHLKVETGINRLGMTAGEALEILAQPLLFPNVIPKAVFTHLTSSSKREVNLQQLERFQPFLDEMHALGVNLPIHMENSHALADFPEGQFDVVRLGLALYGVERVLPELDPSLQAKTVVIQKKPLKAGEGTSYNHLFRAPKDMEIAVIAMGYAEGLSQAMTGKADVLVHGKRVPIIGQICMNLSVIDATGLPLSRGDEVVVIGKQGTEEITVADMARACGVRHHEILTRMGKSLPKVYLGEDVTDSPFPVEGLAARC